MGFICYFILSLKSSHELLLQSTCSDDKMIFRPFNWLALIKESQEMEPEFKSRATEEDNSVDIHSHPGC